MAVITHLEALESRQLLSAAAPTVDVTLTSQGVFLIKGTSGPDAIEMRRRASNAKMLEVVVNGAPRSYRFADVKKVDIDGGAGNDNIWFDATVPLPTYAVILRGGAGDDLILGSKGPDRINGGDGNDLLTGDAGNDSIYGDAGNDQLFGGAGKDLIQSGTGKNTIRGGADKDHIYYQLGIDDISGNTGDTLTKV